MVSLARENKAVPEAKYAPPVMADTSTIAANADLPQTGNAELLALVSASTARARRGSGMVIKIRVAL
jgi:hypothetical protein